MWIMDNILVLDIKGELFLGTRIAQLNLVIYSSPLINDSVWEKLVNVLSINQARVINDYSNFVRATNLLMSQF